VELREYLAVPYLLEARTAEIAPGTWVCRLAYPELPGCVAESRSLEDALRQLEALRTQIIVRMVEAGQSPPVPRPPLVSCDAEWLAEQTGLSPDAISRIRHEKQLPYTS
jgi:hypothetical protein